MKRKLLFTTAACCIATIVAFSCKKKTEDSSITTSKSQLFSGLKSETQTFTVNAGIAAVVDGKDGTVLHFYPNSFKDKNGTIITSGTINIELVEMYKPGKMIANGATTTADNKLLTSGGQVCIKAWKNGQEVFANKYRIAFKQSAASTQPMELFYGNTNNTDSIAIWAAFGDSTKPGTAALTTIAVKDTTSDTTSGGGSGGGGSTYTYPPGIYYIFDSCTNFNWINCDHFTSGTYTLTGDMTITMPDNSFTSSNTNVYVIFPIDNSVMTLYSFSTGVYKPSFGLPVGLSYKLVVITNKKDIYYYYEKSGTITAGEKIDPAMAVETLYDIKARLGAL